MSAVPHLDPFGSGSYQPRGFARPRSVTPSAVVMDGVRALGAYLAAAARRRRNARLLSEMSDSMLRDLGIARSDLERVTRDGR